MKHIAGVLILSSILILTAGCVTDTDKIVGTWESNASYMYYDNVSSGLSFIFYNNGSGRLIETDSDGSIGTFPLVWNLSGNSYQFSIYDSFILSSDGKTLTSNHGYTYTGGEGFTNGVWVQQGSPGYQYTYVFNADKTGTETLSWDGSNSSSYALTWQEGTNGVYFVETNYPFTFSADGKTMTDYDGVECSESNGVWVQQYTSDSTYYYTYEFLRDGICRMSQYSVQTKEAYTPYYYTWFDSADNTRIMITTTPYNMVLQSDGTMKDIVSGDIFKIKSHADPVSGVAF